MGLRSGLSIAPSSCNASLQAAKIFKEELRRAPDNLRVAPSDGGAVLVACSRGGDGGFEIFSWCIGHGTTPRFWDVAAESLQLYEYSAFRVPRAFLEADRPIVAYEGRSSLRHLAACSPSATLGIETLCQADPNEEDSAPEVLAALNELVRPGWAASMGEEVEWHPALGFFAPDSPAASGTADSEGREESGFGNTEASEDEVLFRWLLLGVGEPLDPCEIEDDNAKMFFVKQHRGLGTALVKEGSFEEAAVAFTRALDVCRLHRFFKCFFPEDHGEMFRGVSGIAGAQSYQPQLVSKAERATLAEAHAWVREAAMACHSNLCLCALRQRKFTECAHHAGWVLATDPQHVKALFRRGVATASLGKDLSAALCDLETAKELQPNDAAVQKEIARVKEQMKAARKAERSMFQGILK